MSKLDYVLLLNSKPLSTEVGHIKKPTLRELSELGFDVYSLYLVFLKLTPEHYYTSFKGEAGKEAWENLTDEERKSIKLFDMISQDLSLQKMYEEIFNFFFVEQIRAIKTADDGFVFSVFPEDSERLTEENILTFIGEKQFYDVIEIIQQICCIFEPDKNPENLRFKNNKARKMFERMQKAEAENNRRKGDNSYSLGNLISSVAAYHPSLNLVNIWDITVFQLMDSFNRLSVNTLFGIDKTRVSVWGDEKNTFKPELWYKNYYESEGER